MKQYLLSVVTPSGTAPPPPDVLGPIMERVAAFDRELRDAGAWVFSAGLDAPATASVVRPRGRDLLVVDGPFAEGKEYVGGFSIVRAADRDAALEWGRKLAAATGLPIEVRPFVDNGNA